MFTWSIYITYTLYKLHVDRRNQREQGAMDLPNFLEYLAISWFMRKYLKQNTVARLKSNILIHLKLWAVHATAHVSIQILVSLG